jgi:PPOX class probable F420-dependent enzyme
MVPTPWRNCIVFTDRQRALLDESHIAVLATVGPSGAPHAAPMWYMREGDHIVMLTARLSQKARNLARDARASITVDKRTRPYRALMIDCEAEVVQGDIDEVRGRLARRYVSPDEASAFVASRRGSDSVILRFTPVALAEYPAGR